MAFKSKCPVRTKIVANKDVYKRQIVTCPKLGYFIYYSRGQLYFYLFHFGWDFINLLRKFYFPADVISITTEHMAIGTVLKQSRDAVCVE